MSPPEFSDLYEYAKNTDLSKLFTDGDPIRGEIIVWDWHTTDIKVPWWYHLYLKYWWAPVVEPVKIWWWKLTGQWEDS